VRGGDVQTVHIKAVEKQKKISGLRRPKNVKFGIKEASSTKMMRIDFWNKSFLIVSKKEK